MFCDGVAVHVRAVFVLRMVALSDVILGRRRNFAMGALHIRAVDVLRWWRCTSDVISGCDVVSGRRRFFAMVALYVRHFPSWNKPGPHIRHKFQKPTFVNNLRLPCKKQGGMRSTFLGVMKTKSKYVVTLVDKYTNTLQDVFPQEDFLEW